MPAKTTGTTKASLLQPASASLTEMNSWLLESLRLLDNLLKVLQTELKQSHGPTDIIPFAQPILKNIVSFNATAFYTVDPQTLEFNLVDADPVTEREFIQNEVNYYIEEGTFGWALYQNHPVIMASTKKDRTLLFHVLATRSSILGMFVGVLNERNPFIPDTVQKVLSIILLNCASVMESTILQNELKDYNKNLERIIEERTKELRKSKEEEQAANRAKSLFVANMSHEIRTPLSSIIGFTTLLEKTPLNEKQREYANALKVSSQALMALINDILDFSKIEAGKMDIVESEFDLRRAVEDTLSMVRVRANQKGLALVLDYDERIVRRVKSDPNRLRQILINLVGNAEKFTDQGSVTLRVEVHSETPEHYVVGFSVEDTGIGISEEYLDKIFSTFTQADLSSTRRFGGTGLGLSISSKLVKMLGGKKIAVVSTPGKGSTFSFELPLAKGGVQAKAPAAPVHAAAAKDPGTRYRVLVVDDVAFNVKLAKEILSAAGHEAVGVENGEQALEILRGENFDAVLMDLQMPVMDGLEATRRIRREGIKVPVIAVTASAMEGDHKKCLRVGMNGYVTKPIDVAGVIEAIRRACAGETAPEDKIVPREQTWDSPDTYPVNLKGALARLGGNRKLFKELMQCFLVEQSAEFLNNLRHAVDDKAGEKTAKEAHKIKGAVAALDALVLKELVGKMEEAGRSQDFAKAKELLAEIESEFEELKSYYNLFEA